MQKFDRGRDGSLTPAGTFSTGGAGLTTLGGRQGAVELSGDVRALYAVNAGSDSVSVFRTGHRAPRLVARVRSRGVAPTSVAEHRGRVYVLNSGGTPNVAAFWRRFDGSLAPIPGGTRELARGALGAAQVSVTPDGRSLVVSERLANRLETLPLDFLGPRRAGRDRLQRHGPVRVRHQPAGHDRRVRGRAEHRLLLPCRRPRRAAQHHRLAARDLDFDVRGRCCTP